MHSNKKESCNKYLSFCCEEYSLKSNVTGYIQIIITLSDTFAIIHTRTGFNNMNHYFKGLPFNSRVISNSRSKPVVNTGIDSVISFS